MVNQMRLHPISWKLSGYKAISIMLEIVAFLFLPILLHKISPYYMLLLFLPVALSPLVLYVLWQREREKDIYVEISAAGLTIEKANKPLYFASWDEARYIHTCFGIRDAHQSRYSYDCYNVCISNNPLTTFEKHFDKHLSLNYIQDNSLIRDTWIIYCNRGTKKDCEQLVDTIACIRNLNDSAQSAEDSEL